VPARVLAIVNPQSGSGRANRRWPALEARLRAALAPRGELDVAFTEQPRHATQLAREAIERGVGTVLAAGGDGTFSEVVAGVLESGAASQTELGLIPLGSGGDFPRTLGLTSDAGAAVDVIADGYVKCIDAGRIRHMDTDGKARSGFFVNEASVGISAEVAVYVDSASKRLGGTAAFAQGAIRGIVEFRPNPVRVRIDGEVVFEGEVTLVSVSNGRYFGGAMKIAPDAELDDGVFDVVIGARFTKPQLLFRLLPSLYSGSHVRYEGVFVHRGSRVELEPLDDDSRCGQVEADGELLGCVPVRMELLPQALRMFSPRPPRSTN
jgi:diacylglycerol kinase (ATP)